MSLISLSPSLEKTPVLKKKYGSFIDGSEVTGLNYIKNYNPCNGKVITEILNSDYTIIDKAVKAAKRAYSTWSQLDKKDRSTHIFNLARKVQEYSKELAILEAYDSGKPVKNCRDFDVIQCYETFFYHGGNSLEIESIVPKSKPYGVVAQVIPWNFPLMMLAWKIAPALASGNTVVLKPAPNTSLTALRFAELAKEAGLPDGVINIVTGDGETGDFLLKHEDISKIAFTGSTAVGKSIYKNSLLSGVPATVELGGKSANIVFEDASMDEAIEGVISGIFYNQGQVCSAGSRLLVAEAIEVEFINRLKKRLNSIIMGDPLDKNTELGPLASKQQFEKVSKYLKYAEENNYEIIRSENLNLKADEMGGYFFAPVIVKVDSMSSKLSLDEIFGPFLIYSTFTTPREAVNKANNHYYGLAAGVWSNNTPLALKVAELLEAGTVWINAYNKFSPKAPFGGFKESGIGRENGLLVLEQYREKVSK